VSKRSEQKEEKRKAALLADAKDKKARYIEYWSPIYKDVEAHREFTLMGNQLSSERKAQLGVQNPMQPNLLLTYANHEANKTLQTDYRGKVSPNGGGVNEVQARARQDALRGLQRTNNINQVYNQARRNQICGGIAYSIEVVDYAAKRGFGKTIKPEFLEDYQNVLPDPDTKSATMDDIRDFLYKKEVAKGQWEAETGEEPKSWGNKKKKDLWYYWVREDEQDTEYLLEDGKMETGAKLDGDLSRVKKGKDAEELSRPITNSTWCFYKMDENFTTIYEETEWKGTHCPLVACTGRRVVSADGTVRYQPLTQFAEEAQEIYTILENIICLRLSRSPFSKWKVALESVNIKADEILQRASVMGDGTIWYKHLDDAGNLIPPPEEIEPHILDKVLIELQREQENKIQKIFGIFDANLGEKSNEQSGIAIERRAQGGDLSNFDLQFNYMEYVKQDSRVTLDLIPKYLTAPQQMAFVDEEDKTVMRWINTTGGIQFAPDEECYLSIEAMPISPTAREDEAKSLMEMAKAIGPVMTENPDVVALIIKAQPGRYTGQIAELVAKGSPQLQEAKGVIQQLQQELQQAQGEAQKVQMDAQIKQANDQMMIASLKQANAGMKQQMVFTKQMADMEGMTEQARAQYDQVIADGERQIADNDKTLEALELQLKAKDSESKRMDSDSNRIKAESAMIVAVDKASRPDPQPKAPGAAST
jgi:hypothetical protein